MSVSARRVTTIGLALTASVALTLSGSAQTSGTPERFTAMAVNMDNGRTSTVDIVVNRWSTEAERTKLMSVLLEKGPEKLLDVLQKAPRVGYFRTPQSTGWDLHYAHHAPLPDGGERVVIATDRRINFWEAANRPRSIDYPFTVIELHINRDGEGEGKMSIATKITAEKESNTIVLENYGTQPVLLQSVKREKASH
jgi:hypothetical protein